jgi:kynureninase
MNAASARGKQLESSLSGVPDRAAIAALDAADPLARFRERFVIAEPDVIYLDGNSLGRLPLRSRPVLDRVIDEEWGTDLVRGWSHWIDEPIRVGDVLARDVLGAQPGEVLVGDSTTVNLYKLAFAAATLAREEDPARTVLVTTADNFPTDRYILEGLAQQLGMQLRLVPVGSSLEAALETALGPDTALVCLSHVEYASGERYDLAAITTLGRHRGARVLWDLSHSAGAVPIRLAQSGAELAVGCTYKYLNAGPGAPAYLYVHRDLQPLLRSPIWGWFGQADQFGMADAYDPAAGILRFAAGTPPILGLPLVDVGAQLIGEAGIDALATKSAGLTELMIELADEWLTPLGFRVATPREPQRRGGHVSLAHEHARQICRALIESAGVIPDYRAGPDGSGTVRLGPAPLYTSYGDVLEAMSRLRDLVSAGDYLRFSADTGRVT